MPPKAAVRHSRVSARKLFGVGGEGGGGHCAQTARSQSHPVAGVNRTGGRTQVVNRTGGRSRPVNRTGGGRSQPVNWPVRTAEECVRTKNISRNVRASCIDLAGSIAARRVFSRGGSEMGRPIRTVGRTASVGTMNRCSGGGLGRPGLPPRDKAGPNTRRRRKAFRLIRPASARAHRTRNLSPA